MIFTPVHPFAYQWPDSDTVEVFHPGMHVRESHPAVVSHRACFIAVEDLPMHGKGGVETTRQNPGEKRDVNRPAS